MHQGGVCPRCGSGEIEFQTFQENQGGTTVTHSTSRYREKGHGCLWWLMIGWWWWVVDLCLWIFMFIPRALLHIGRKRKYKEETTSVTKTRNKITYKTLGRCRHCGHTWEA